MVLSEFVTTDHGIKLLQHLKTHTVGWHFFTVHLKIVDFCIRVYTQSCCIDALAPTLELGICTFTLYL